MKYTQQVLITEPGIHGGRRNGAGRPTNKAKKKATKERMTVFLPKSTVIMLKIKSVSTGWKPAEIIASLINCYLDEYRMPMK